jgi:hypothetical protein
MTSCTQHVFVRGLQVGATAEYLTGEPQRRQALHLAQGQLDALCGVYALCTALMLLKGYPREQALRLTRARRGPFAQVWTAARELAFVGSTPADLVKLVRAADLGLQTEVLTTARADRIAAAARKAIDAGSVPLLEFESSSWAHWCLVAGCELRDGATVRALLTLDPDRRAPELAGFNGRVEIERRGTRRLIYRALGRTPLEVRPRSLLVIARAPPG